MRLICRTPPTSLNYPLSQTTAKSAQRFVAVCQNLAGYSVINDEAALNVSSTGVGDWSIKADLPSREAFGGTSVALRQLHSNQEPASFDKVKGRLFKATNLPVRPASDRRGGRPGRVGSLRLAAG